MDRFSKILKIEHKNGCIVLEEVLYKQFKNIHTLINEFKKDQLPRFEFSLYRNKWSEKTIPLFIEFYFFCLLSFFLNYIFDAKNIISVFNGLVFIIFILDNYYKKPTVIKLNSKGIELVSLLKLQFVNFKKIESIKQNKKFLNSSLEICYNSKKVKIYKRHYKEIDTFFEVYKNLVTK